MSAIDLATLRAGLEELRKESEPHAGKIYFNRKRGNCLRVIDVQNDKAHCISFRANGCKDSTRLRVSCDSLRKNYEEVLEIRVKTPWGEQVYGWLGERWEADGR